MAAATTAGRPEMLEQAQRREADRQRDRGREQHVHRGGMAVGEGQQRRAGDEAGVQARGRAVEARAEERRRPDQQQRGEHRGQAGRGLGLAEQRVRHAGEPVVERRLLEPGLALERRRHPLAGALHLDRDARVAGLVGADERNVPRRKRAGPGRAPAGRRRRGAGGLATCAHRSVTGSSRRRCGGGRCRELGSAARRG